MTRPTIQGQPAVLVLRKEGELFTRTYEEDSAAIGLGSDRVARKTADALFLMSCPSRNGAKTVHG